MWSGDGVSSVRLVLLMLVVFVGVALATTTSINAERQYCGKALPQILKLVCNNCYNTRDKKYIHNSIDDSYWAWASQQPRRQDGDLPDAEGLQDLDESEHQPPFRDRLRAADMIGDTYRRFTRNIVGECCHKECSLSEVQNYCCASARRSF